MPTSTTMATFRAALFTAISTEATLATIQCFYGDPVEAPPLEAIYLGSSASADMRENSLHAGRRIRTEEYDTEIVLRVAKGTTQQACEARTAVLLAALDNVLVADPSTNPIITTTGVTAAWPTRMTMKTAETGEGPVTLARITIRTQARLT